MSAQDKSKKDGEPGKAEDTAFGEKTQIAEEKDLETVIMQPEKKGAEPAATPPAGPDSTIAAPLGEVKKTGEDAAFAGKSFGTVIMQRAGSESETVSPEPASPVRRSPEAGAKNEQAGERPAESSSKLQYVDLKIRTGREGTGMKNFLLTILLLLVLGAGALAALYKINPNSEILKLLPFKWGNDSQQQTAQAPSADTQAGAPATPQADTTAATQAGTPTIPKAGTPAIPQKYERIVMGMTVNAVLQILGEPSQKKTAEKTSQWEYDTGAGLYQIKFQNDLVASWNMAAYSDSIGVQASVPPTIPPPVVTYAQSAPQSASPASTGYDRVQMGMTTESVRQILGEPLETRTVGQLTEWEYDAKTGLFQVAFEGGKVAFKGRTPYHSARADQAVPPTTIPKSTAPVVAAQAGSSSASTTASSASPAVPSAPTSVSAVSTTPSRDYSKIVLGMTPEIIKQIMGEPSQVKKLRVSTEWEYQTPKGVFEVRFRDEKVVYKGLTR